MRLDRLDLQNFRKFANLSLEFDPQLTLLVGENGSGKTSILDAAAVSLGIWLVDLPDSILANSRRNILPSEIRLVPSLAGDRIQFREQLPTSVGATGLIAGEPIEWVRQIPRGRKRTSNTEAKRALAKIRGLYQQDAAGIPTLCPVMAYYGAGRAWLPSNQVSVRTSKTTGGARRWAAFYDCFNERIRFDELRGWFQRETTAAGNRGGRMRPGFEAVKRAVLACIPEADELWFDADRDQIVLSIAHKAQPFDNLSAGQRMMLALVADIAIKVITQNAHLLPEGELAANEPWPRVLSETPGVILIDEIDVHLHPRWQRRGLEDLQRAFPRLQFIATTHSATLISEARPESLRLLRETPEGHPKVEACSQAYGLDVSYILEHIQGSRARPEKVGRVIAEVEAAIDAGELGRAREYLAGLRLLIHGEDPKSVELEATINHLEAFRDAVDS